LKRFVIDASVAVDLPSLIALMSTVGSALVEIIFDASPPDAGVTEGWPVTR
jgi:hypothetical protein